VGYGLSSSLVFRPNCLCLLLAPILAFSLLISLAAGAHASDRAVLSVLHDDRNSGAVLKDDLAKYPGIIDAGYGSAAGFWQSNPGRMAGVIMAQSPSSLGIPARNSDEPLDSPRWRVAVAVSILILQAVLIAGLLIARKRHRQADEVLNRLMAVVESSDDAIMMTNLEGTVTDWNRGAGIMYGYSADDIKGKNISVLSPAERTQELSEIAESVRRQEGIRNLESVRLRRDGSRIDVSLTVAPILDSNGHVIGASTVARDITERHRENELRIEIEERFRTLTENAPVMIWVAGPDACCTFFNRQWLEFTGRTLEQEMGNGWTEGVHPEDRERCFDTYLSAFNAHSSFTMEYRLRRADGQFRWIFDTGVPRFGSDGKFAGYIGSCLDISERRQSEQYLHDLTSRLFQLQDEERKRVSADLHDGLGQSLAIIKNRAQLGLTSRENPERIMEQLEEISSSATAAILEVQEIAHNLRPYELDRLGLAAAIESMVERVSNTTSISLSADLERVEDLLSPEAETSVYRIVQEGLNNVIRHSNASAARIEIRASGKSMTILIQDNGSGIDSSGVQSTSAGGWGLAGIAERVRGLGGSFDIDSQPEHGTTLTVRLESNGVEAR